VAPNLGPTPRKGTLSIAGKTFTVWQKAPGQPELVFADVSPANFFYQEITKLASIGITTGCGRDANNQPLFCPEAVVTREQMAVFIERALGAFAPPAGLATPSFADVGRVRFSYDFIEDFLRQGITTGCGRDGSGRLLFCPEAVVTRATMAAFLVRAFGL
jgi:hypothetical protein